MFLLGILLYFFVVNLLDTFPLKDCSSKTTELLIFIDCRHDLSQLGDISSLVSYLRVQRHWKISNATYMTISENGLYTLNESDIFSNNYYFDSIKINCSEKFDQFVAVQEAKEWCQEQVSATRIAFIFHITDFDCEDSFYQNVRKELLRVLDVNIYFIVYRLNSQRYSQCFTQNFIDSDVFKHFRGLAELYSRICDDTGCPLQDLTYTTENVLQSFYHVNFSFSKISQNEAFEYCSKIPNNYLVSLETMEEFEFIFQYVLNVYSRNGSSYTELHTGQLPCTDLPRWSSGFLILSFFREKFQSCTYKFKGSIFPQTCLALTSTKYNEEYELFAISNSNRTIYFKEIACTDQNKNSVVICECHTHLSQKQLIQNIFYDNSKDFLISSLTLYSVTELFFEGKRYNFKKFGIKDLKKIICKQNNTLRSMQNNIDCGALLNNTETDVMHLLLKRNDYVLLQNYNNFTKCLHNSSYDENTNENENGDEFSGYYYSDTQGDSIGIECTLLKLNLSFETVQCENSSQRAYKCIYDVGPICNHFSNLRNCEKFICPKNFFKCPKSYCIRLDQLGDGINDCRFGEDELILRQTICYANINVTFMEMCISLDNAYFDLNPNYYTCSKVCPTNYKCFSNRKFKQDIGFEFDIYSIRLELYNISDVIFPNVILIFFFKLHILQFQALECKLKDFDLAMRYWNLHHLYSLDLSFNEMESSEDFQSFYQMGKLKILNMSFNPITTINTNFLFPDRLEIIDLSNTRLNAIPLNVFYNLKQLKSLSLKNTFIASFKDMGIPDYFNLNYLYIQGIMITNIETNFFKGLTIRSGLWTSDFRLCCPQVLNFNISSDKCHGPIDVISSCKNLVGDLFKRFVIWIVGLVTIVGNGIVLAYRLVWKREIFKNAYGLFVTGLAFSDFLMGIYLMMISSADIYYQDVYVLEETRWRNGILCQVSGFLSTLSSETSTFFICLITLDRFLTITYPLGEFRLPKLLTRVLFTLAWIVGIILAAIPVVVSSYEIYSSNSLCLALPFSSNHFRGWEFSFVVYVGVNFILFIVIAFGQVAIFVNIYRRKQSMSFLKNCRKRRLEDLAVAKKLAFVAMSDFLCWFPIGVIGYFSMTGYTFDRDVYAWFAVFVLPINSALNPIIYTIPALYVKCSAN